MSSDPTTGLRVPSPGHLLAMRCRCCNSRNVELVIDLGDQPHCNRLVRPDEARVEPRFPLRLGFCNTCSMVQIDHTIPKESMFSDYPYVSGTTSTLPAHFRATSERLAGKYKVRPRDLIVDIGSNDGTWLKQWGFTGARVLGVEAAANVANIALSAGVPTLSRFFDERCAHDIRRDHGPAKVVTAAGVFFHLEELHSVVRGIEALLDDQGIFVVQAIYLGGMVQNTAFDQIYHEHLCYYTLRSLSFLLEQHGLEIFEATVLPIHGGSLEAHVARKGARAIGNSVRNLEAEEDANQLGKIETYRSFAQNVLILKERLYRLLLDYSSMGQSVWAYGAPAKGATLLNSFGIGPSLVQQAVEKNPLKVGLAIPGVRIPIMAETDARPDAYLVLAWNFIDEFVVKERTWLSTGGKLIVPIPDVKTYDQTDV